MGTIPAFNVIFQQIERLIPTLPCTMHMSSSLDSIKDKRPENRGHNNSKNNKIALIQSNIYFILGKFRSNINSHGNETWNRCTLSGYGIFGQVANAGHCTLQ